MSKLGLEQRINVKDGQRTITFMGWFLGFATSETPDSVRWTELSLYRTLQGAYVLEKVGRSDVFHSEDCERQGVGGKKKSKGKRYTTLYDALPDEAEAFDELSDFFVPCAECKPEWDESPVWVERDIYSAPVHDSAEKVVAALYQTKGQNRFLSKPARDLLEQAMQKDSQIRAAVEKPVEIA
jgi:hypothetical protein